ncbi:hypothetical protein K450DRAFT_281876 [Umbelopsis ramanniana AG]|uniref:DinB-like domain-containing protein n=1 Tax=Umbelopsis ramanniana AG TaxID=1314678 RepID=A0AAD5E7S8_UMBRA|nr:uncharacterized protein K450DRAFT_281876 [Umbelopsis ramanniana AG]KAI8578269.1 hypothetical protein K450DRAFT_281876 [Umbelopsis ramanniana AG]
MAQTKITTHSTDGHTAVDSLPVTPLSLKVQRQSGSSNLIEISRKILEQPIDLIINMSQDVFTQESKLMPKSTIGKHIRHMSDHFRILLSNPDLSCNDLNYDLRSRNVAAETDPTATIQLLRDLESRLSTLEDIPFSQKVTLTATIDPNMPPEQYASSLGRELWYCCIHAIHHYASVKTICLEHGLDVPDSFGVAPSTLQHAQESHHD